MIRRILTVLSFFFFFLPAAAGLYLKQLLFYASEQETGAGEHSTWKRIEQTMTDLVQTISYFVCPRSTGSGVHCLEFTLLNTVLAWAGNAF